ncbi:MAG: hypothetical protein ABS894_08790 [Aerococcus urinaeequi]
MLDIIYDELNYDEIIQEQVKGRIRYYTYNENDEMVTPFIIITPLSTPIPAIYGSNQELAIEMTCQLSVEGVNRKQVKELAYRIKQLMWELGFGQLEFGLDEYLDDVERFVDVRRYRKVTNLYETNY